MKVLAESPRYILGHEWEYAVLLDKHTGEKHDVGYHCGDPCAGLIAPEETWFVTAGEGVVYFDFRRGLHTFLREGFPCWSLPPGPAFIHAIRLAAPASVRVLVDPWSEGASVWELETDTLQIRRLQDGPSLVGQPYQENVDF